MAYSEGHIYTVQVRNPFDAFGGEGGISQSLVEHQLERRSNLEWCY